MRLFFHYLLALCAFGNVANAETVAQADVVVIVDTSTSMKNPGMDPEQTSFLVTKLLTDIVPGDLAVVRLLDLVADRDVLPRRETGMTKPCDEDPSRQCGIVEPATDWRAEARTNKLGVLSRPARGDDNYKRKLKQHLEQRIHNSSFYLAFYAAQGVFDEHSQQASIPRTIIWLSDGRAEHEIELKQVIEEIKSNGVAIEAIIFGNGDPRIPREIGLDVRQTSNPAELMKAFAGAFRRIVKAPYEIDNLVSIEPRFLMKPNVKEAWIVVYGDKTLGNVELDGPNGTIKADYAADRLDTAGAYKVAYLQRPKAGQWTVHATGGGPSVAYAVVQRSNLAPALLEPKSAIAETPVLLVAGIRAGHDGDLINDPELIENAVITAEFQGKTVRLRNEGGGRYTAEVIFRGSGSVPVQLHLTSSTVERSIDANVAVSGLFKYTGGPLKVDLGSLGVDQESCRPLKFRARHQGDVPFELKQLKSTPAGHHLEVRLSNGSTLSPEGKLIFAKATDQFKVCLKTSDDVASSSANGEHWLDLHVANSDALEHQLPIHLQWTVKGLTFWERWGWLILSILAVLVIIVIIAGYIVPHRFPAGLALVFVPDYDDLDEQSPQPIKQWKGVGIGWYRNAQAFLHRDYRISGKSHGALAGLHAEKNKRIIIKGSNIFRETLDGDWEGATKQKARAGGIYRIGETGPYFRIAVRR
jgi:hypothetical protein